MVHYSSYIQPLDIKCFKQSLLNVISLQGPQHHKIRFTFFSGPSYGRTKSSFQRLLIPKAQIDQEASTQGRWHVLIHHKHVSTHSIVPMSNVLTPNSFSVSKCGYPRHKLQIFHCTSVFILIKLMVPPVAVVRTGRKKSGYETSSFTRFLFSFSLKLELYLELSSQSQRSMLESVLHFNKCLNLTFTV